MKTLQGSTLLLLLLTAGCGDTYKPVIYVHGLFSGSEQFLPMAQFISTVHPETQVVAIDNLKHTASFVPMWKQVTIYRRIIKRLMQMYPDGVHLICYSQGALICRAVLSTLPDHNVHTFIALAGPLAGLYRDPPFLKQVPPGVLVKTANFICPKKDGQKVSVCNYWNDPFHRSSYLRNNNFLPQVNGETTHSKKKVWKENFLRIKKLVLIGGSDDGVITPWQSSFFGFIDRNKNIIDMRDQQYYKDDSFGLKTLDERGDIFVCNRTGVKHSNWPSNFTVFTDCMEPFLT